MPAGARNPYLRRKVESAGDLRSLRNRQSPLRKTEKEDAHDHGRRADFDTQGADGGRYCQPPPVRGNSSAGGIQPFGKGTIDHTAASRHLPVDRSSLRRQRRIHLCALQRLQIYQKRVKKGRIRNFMTLISYNSIPIP